MSNDCSAKEDQTSETSAAAAAAMEQVEAGYTKIAVTGGFALAHENQTRDVRAECLSMGYTEADLALGKDANLGLGCGNPVSRANIQAGETVVDLGSGGGFDCFLAGEKVGPNGSVIGVDKLPEMVKRARQNSKARGATNVSFRLGEIAYLPVADHVADVIISNGVLCLALNPRQVFRDAFRILRPGGRFIFADMVSMKALPPELQTAKAFASWVGGTSPPEDLKKMMEDAGFIDVSFDLIENSADFVKEWLPGLKAEEFVKSAYFTAHSPSGSESAVRPIKKTRTAEAGGWR